MDDRAKKLPVVINPVQHRRGSYVAHFTSEYLHATFSVCFKDTITGALALHRFAGMLRKEYESEVEFILSERRVAFTNEALVDLLKSGSAVCTGMRL